MKKLIVFTLLFFTVFDSAFSIAQFNPQKLSLTWEVLENDYQGKNQIKVLFKIQNTDKQSLPVKGWRIYFNSGRKISQVSQEIQFHHINGDLNYLEPTGLFKGLKTGETIDIVYVALGRAVNTNDAPVGFYFVWDNIPNNAVDLNAPVIRDNKSLHTQWLQKNEQAYLKNSLVADFKHHELSPVLPTPVSYTRKEGKFVLDKNVSIYTNSRFIDEAKFLAKEIYLLIGHKPIISEQPEDKKINFEWIEGMTEEEYQLSISQDKVTIRASNTAGAFYAIQSLKSMFPISVWKKREQKLEVDCMEVTDKPRFAYRAFMLDVARNFQTKQQVLKIIDLLSLYKVNTLHFHLNDDEGWRLEIPSLPELTLFGSVRKHKGDVLSPSYGSGSGKDANFGTGHYSKNDFIEILKYAKERHITIIPEIETPGHARAAVKSMLFRYERLMKEGKEEQAKQFLLNDIEDKSVYQSVQKWNDNVMNIGLESTYNFITQVVDELIEMYKTAGANLQTIHVGGDEVPAGVWTKSKAIDELKLKYNLVTDNDLWDYHFSRINKILKDRRVYVSAWEEAALIKTRLFDKDRYTPNPKFVNENFHVYVWNNVWGWGSEDLAYRLANYGYKTVLAPVTNYYLDMMQDLSFSELGTYWGAITPLESSFDFVPYNYYQGEKKNNKGEVINPSVFQNRERLTDFGKSNIVGMQCLIWSELVKGPENLEYLLLPRLLGFAERAWSDDPEWANNENKVLYQKEWSQFLNILGKRELKRLDYYNGGFSYRVPKPVYKVENNLLYVNTEIPGFEIRYTVNGDEPTIKSLLYTKPLNKKGEIKLKVFTFNGRSGETVKVVND